MHMHAQRMPMRISFKGKYACKAFARGLWAMTLDSPLVHLFLSPLPHLPCYGLIFVHLDLIAVGGQALHAVLWLHISHVHIIEGLRHFLCVSLLLLLLLLLFFFFALLYLAVLSVGALYFLYFI